VVLDSTHLSLDEVIEAICQLAEPALVQLQGVPGGVRTT
jgi:hypothetical protein